MASREKECVVWCPSCRVEKYEIWRVATQGEGVYTNESVPAGRSEKSCGQCGTILERKS